jgi:ABC-type polysaccharide/polyol phosphate export permease
MSNIPLPVEPPDELRFHRKVHFFAAAAEIWAARELIFTLAERDLRARYKQAILGFAWAVVTPLALTVVFTVFFKGVAKIDTRPAPYPVFAYLGLIPWTFFSSSMSNGGLSLVSNAPLLNKVYCPREVFPLAAVGVAWVDSVLSLVALAFLFVLYGYAPRATSYWLPVLFIVQLAWTAGITMVVSAVTIYLRDLRHVLPILLQLGLFATPVAYGIDKIPVRFRGLYATLNPLAPVIDGYRRTVLYNKPPDWHLLGLGSITATVLLLGGYALFKRLETGIADVA